MKTGDLISTAFRNTFRSKSRLTLTILSIFVGAFTITLTSGLGTGINRYIEDTVSSLGTSDVMTVTKLSEDEGATQDSGPQVYDPDTVSSQIPGATTTVMSDADLETIAAVDGIAEVQAVKSISLDYVQVGDGTLYTASIGSLIPDQTLQLAAGSAPDSDSEALEIAIPSDYVDALGFDSAEAAVGETLSITLTDAAFTQHTIDATIVGVSEESLVGQGTSSFSANDALTDELFDAQSTGLPDDQRDQWASANAWFDSGLTDEQIDAVQSDLEEAGFSGVTVDDQLGLFTTVIDTIVLVLNGFAAIALIAAAFGIINTLLMSVQERTREIGLMKAMGMSSGRVFAMFSMEAGFIGLLGSVIGVGVAMIVGTAVSAILSNSFLEDLAGFTLIAFDASDIALTIVIIMVVALLAGTIPAANAARKDPVEALRYE